MSTLQIKHIDAFTKDPWCGNPAGVVLDASALSDQQMQYIAKEMNLSETAFISPATTRDADIRLRWFTPAEEVDLCGHATIASFHALSESGMLGMQKEGQYRFTVETRSGLLGIVVDKTSSGEIIEFELPLPVFRPIQTVPDALLNALGMKSSDLPNDLPAVIDAYAYLPIRSKSALYALNPSYRELAGAVRSIGATSICVFTLETVESTSAVHSRFFAPGLGVEEDPVTGSANGPLGVYLETYVRRQHPSIPSAELPDGRREYVGEQGDVLGRPGRVGIRLAMEGSDVRRVWVVGRAVTVMDSMLRLTDTV